LPWDNRVSEGVHADHPIGSPIIHSQKAGPKLAPWVFRKARMRLTPGHFCMEGAIWLAVSVGVGKSGQGVHASALVRSPDFLRREDSRTNAVAQAEKVSGDLTESQVQMVGDVFDEDDSRARLFDDPLERGPEVSGVLGAFAPASTGRAPRLARVASDDGVDAAELRDIERVDVVPDGCEVETSFPHSGLEDLRSGCGLLDVADGEGIGASDPKSQVERANT